MKTMSDFISVAEGITPSAVYSESYDWAEEYADVYEEAASQHTLDIYDSLPSIVRALSTSIKQLVYTSHTQIVAYALSFIYHAIQQGLLYAVDCIDLVVYHLPSSTRTVNLSFII